MSYLIISFSICKPKGYITYPIYGKNLTNVHAYSDIKNNLRIKNISIY